MCFTSSPLFYPPEKDSPLLDPKICRAWKDPERTSIVGAELNLCLVAGSQATNLAFFSASSRSPLLAEFFERSRNPHSRGLPDRPGFSKPGAVFLEFRRAGHVPPSPDFRPSALSFVLELQLIGSRSLFLGLGYRRRFPCVLGTGGGEGWNHNSSTMLRPKL